MKKEQGHGDHIGAIMEPRDFLANHLTRLLNTSELVNKCFTQAVSDTANGEKTNVFTLAKRDNDITWVGLIVEGKDTNEFVSCFPLLKPAGRVKAKIVEVGEWTNMVEATITCEIDDYDGENEGIELSFFATDYARNKARYIVGEYCYIDLAAIAYSAHEGERGFSFEGQKAIGFLSKIGQAPDYDENGNVQPVHFNTENLVQFLNHNDDYPDDVQFQSPITNITSINTVGVDLYRCEMLFKHYPDRKLALYFKREFIPEPTDGMPVAGMMWLQGSISDNQED